VSVELLNMDCMDYLRDLPDNAFDLAICDPPFGIGNFVQNSGNKRGDKVTWNDNTPSNEYFYELNRVSKERIIFGANYYNCFDVTGGAIVWVKNQPMPNFSKAVIASCSMHKKIEIYTQTWTNYVGDRFTSHPCEMPVNLYQWLLDNYAEKGQRILDTHLGSGSSAIAAHYFGCDFVGLELDEDYYKAACKRFDQMTRQEVLF